MELLRLEIPKEGAVARALARMESWPIGRGLDPGMRRWLLAGLLAAVLLLIPGFVLALISRSVFLGLLASTLAGLATGLGALPIVFFRRVSSELMSILLGGAAGVMLAATAFSLIVPGIAHGDRLWSGSGVWVVALGLGLGCAFLHWADRHLPHDHRLLRAPNAALHTSRKIWLFILAITLHNFPEGLAVGVSFAVDDWRSGLVLATAIGLQNVPEGLAVALLLVALGYARGEAVAVALLTGLVEPVGGLLGVSLVALFSPVLPLAMGFAAGAMLFVICDEIIPEAHDGRNPRAATFAIVSGFVLMTVLDNVIR